MKFNIEEWNEEWENRGGEFQLKIGDRFVNWRDGGEFVISEMFDGKIRIMDVKYGTIFEYSEKMFRGLLHIREFLLWKPTIKAELTKRELEILYYALKAAPFPIEPQNGEPDLEYEEFGDLVDKLWFLKEGVKV